MNVYDFDNTLLKGDSTARFFAYCFARHPRLWLDIPMQAVNGLLFVLKIRRKQDFKQRMLSFVSRLKDPEAEIDAFWTKNFSRIKPFYAEIQKADDVVISASPEFLIAPACKKLNIAVCMGTPADLRTGKFNGLNCHGEEKVRRFRERFPDGVIDDFYSDSHSDDPLAHIAKRAFLVIGEKRLPWN